MSSTASGAGAADDRRSSPVRIRIEGTDLPGRSCGASPDTPGYENIHVGVPHRGRRDDLLGLVAGDAPTAVWEIDCEIVAAAAGVDWKGPFVQGRPHERFVYLSWGTVDEAGSFTMFRRAKLWLDCLDRELIDSARQSGRLVARLGLSDAHGNPRCAAVRPPLVQWSTG